MSIAIFYETDGFSVDREKPMGRHFAGMGFLSAYARHKATDSVTAYVRRQEIGQEFLDVVQALRPGLPARFVTLRQAAELHRIGCLYVSEPITAKQLWARHLHGPGAWSLCGVNHTLSSAGAMDTVTGWLTAPVQPWDAVICTSRASRDVIQRLLERQAAFLAERLGATRFSVPQLPIIPLGVDCDTQMTRRSHRDECRAALGIRPEEAVILFLGRLSFHAKANPAPMYLALERIAARHPIVLVECGWTANDEIDRALRDGRNALCPSVRSIVLDGRREGERLRAWASADIFCSLSDNIQETFGLTPIEAMAAGLPVVVSDWDGYRDTVRDGIDGFTVPTISAPPGIGGALAARHALEFDTYDRYIGQASAATAVDIDAVTRAIETLAADPDLRRRMGENSARRARETFDWSVVIDAYRNLWQFLAEKREEVRRDAKATAGGLWPARLDPFYLFESFPTSRLSRQDRIRRVPGMTDAEVEARLGLRIAVVDLLKDVPAKTVLEVRQAIGLDGTTGDEILAARPGIPWPALATALLLLAKLGLVTIEQPGAPPLSEHGA